jgi:hypothetical protein
VCCCCRGADVCTVTCHCHVRFSMPRLFRAIGCHSRLQLCTTADEMHAARPPGCLQLSTPCGMLYRSPIVPLSALPVSLTAEHTKACNATAGGLVCLLQSVHVVLLCPAKCVDVGSNASLWLSSCFHFVGCCSLGLHWFATGSASCLLLVLTQ